jgi:hypothetical protein
MIFVKKMKNLRLSAPIVLFMAGILGYISSGFCLNRAMVYYYCGGWRHEEGIPATNQALTELSQEHGFELVLTEDEADLNLDNLRTFDVIIWNNNVNGALSVQSTSARSAVEDYVREGGRWVGIHGAGDHLDTWTYLADMVASRFLAHGDQEDNMVAVDDEALADPDIQQALIGVPTFETLHEEWYSFTVNVRGQPGITVIYTLLESENPNYTGPEMGDHPFVWVNKNPEVVGEGLALYNAFGHRGDIYTQKDGFSKSLLWSSVQYAADVGQCTAGCKDVTATNYDPLVDCAESTGCIYATCCGTEGYVEYDPNCTNHDASACQTVGISSFQLNNPGIQISSDRISVSLNSAYTVEVVDVSGERVLSQSSSGVSNYSLSDLQAGIYFVKITAPDKTVKKRIKKL